MKFNDARRLLAGVALTAAALLAPQANAADMIDPATGYPIYVSIFGGASFLDNVKGNYVSSSGSVAYGASLNTKTGYLIGGAIGVNWNDFIRTEVELSHSSWKAKSLTTSGGSSSNASGHVNATYLLGNVWLDLHNSTPLTPYIGGGLGMAWASEKISTASLLSSSDKDSGFAFQLGAGVKYDLTDAVSIDLGYRYKDVSNLDFSTTLGGVLKGADLHSHNIQLGLTFQF